MLPHILSHGNSEINKYILPIMEFTILLMIFISVCNLALLSMYKLREAIGFRGFLSGSVVKSENEVKVKVPQSCPTLCNPMDYAVHGILQARIPGWVAFPFSRISSQPRDWIQVSHISGRFFTSWTTREAQEYWSEQPVPSPADLPDQELNQALLHCRRILQCRRLGFNTWAGKIPWRR